MGIRKSDPRYNNKDLCICHDHPMITITKPLRYTYYDDKLKKMVKPRMENAKFLVPVPVGKETNGKYSNHYCRSKGLGTDR